MVGLTRLDVRPERNPNMTLSLQEALTMLVETPPNAPASSLTREEVAEAFYDATARLEQHEGELLVTIRRLNEVLSQIDDSAVYMERMSGRFYRHETVKVTPKLVFVRAIEGPLEDQQRVVRLERATLEMSGRASQRRTWFQTYHLGWSYRNLVEKDKEEQERLRQQVAENILAYRTNRDIWYGVPVSDREWEHICQLVPEKRSSFDERLDWRKYGF
jgi:hypothetical protein